MSPAVARIATAEHVAQAQACLTTAFASDLFARWVMADPAQFLRLFNHSLRHMGGLGSANGAGFLADGGIGAALWLRPGVGPDMAALGALMAELTMPDEAPAVFEQMSEQHPQNPHWYLPFIGVDPAAQGQHVGSTLLVASLALVDEEGLPAYLESTNPRNVPLYERFGFRVLGEIQVGSSPVMHPMWREAR